MSSYLSDEDESEEYEYEYNYTFSGETETSSVSSNNSHDDYRERRHKDEGKSCSSDKRPTSNDVERVRRGHRDSHTSHHSSYTKSSQHSRSRKHQVPNDRSSMQIHRTSHQRNSCTSYLSDQSGKTKSSSLSYEEEDKHVIALFGAYGLTGHYFLQFALEAGYHVQALIPPGVTLEDLQGNENLKLVTGAMNESDKVRKVVKRASYVVCMLNDCDQSLHHPPRADDGSAPTSTIDFVKILFPLLEEYNRCRVLLYQASSSAMDAKGVTPLFSQVCKTLALRKTQREFLQEQDNIVSHICKQSAAQGFNFVVTRPGNMVWDRPSRSKLAASKSQPGPFPIMHVDLAEFSLNALLSERLYNTCPYVVADHA